MTGRLHRPLGARMIPALFFWATSASPWAFVGVAAALICLILAGGAARWMRERCRSRTITETANALARGGIVVQRSREESLFVAVPGTSAGDRSDGGADPPVPRTDPELLPIVESGGVRRPAERRAGR